MVIRINSMANIGLYIACFIAFTFYGVDYFIPGLTENMSTVYLACGVIIIVCSLFTITSSGLHNLKATDICVFILLIMPLLWNNRNLEAGGYTRPLQYLWIAFLYIAFRCSRKEDWIDKFIKILMFVGVFYALFTVLSYISSDFYFGLIYPKLSTISATEATRLNNYYDSGYMSGITAHYSTNGIYIGLGTIPFFVCALIEKRYYEKKRFLLMVAFLGVLLALALTGKRAHLIFTLAALIVVMYFYFSDQKVSRVFKILFFLILAGVAVYIVSLFIPQIMNAYNRILEGLAENNLDNGRNELYAYALLMFPSAPIFGHGWAWFSVYNPVSPGDHAHNTYYQLLCETGVVGFTLYVGLLVILLIRGIRLLIRLCSNKQNSYARDRAVVCCAVAYEIFFLMYMVSGNPLYEFSCYMPLFLFAAAVETIGERFRSDSRSLQEGTH